MQQQSYLYGIRTQFCANFILARLLRISKYTPTKEETRDAVPVNNSDDLRFHCRMQ